MFDDCNRLFKGNPICARPWLDDGGDRARNWQFTFGDAGFRRRPAKGPRCQDDGTGAGRPEFPGPSVGNARPPVGPACRRRPARGCRDTATGNDSGRDVAGVEPRRRSDYIRSIMALPKPEHDTCVAPGISRAKS